MAFRFLSLARRSNSLLRNFSGFPSLSTFSDDENILRESVYSFAREKIAPFVKEMDISGKLHPSVLPALFEQGLMSLEIPENYGGSGLSFTQSCIVIQELAKVDPTISVIVDIQNTLINASIRKFGSEFLKSKYLPRLSKDMLGSFCLSEASSGSDAFALKTRAKLENGKYIINGSKLWISNATHAGMFLVFANINFDAGYKGITAFVVDRDTPGLEIGQPEDKLGLRASATCPVTFEDVKVDASQLLGTPGNGYKVAISLLNQGRVGIAAQMVGLAEGAFDTGMKYIMERKQFGQNVANFQGMQFSYANEAMKIEAARLLMMNACRLIDSNVNCVKEASMAKLFSSQVAESVASKAIEWHGGLGFSKSCAAEKYYRDAKIGSIYEGTSNMQLQGIAKILQSEYTNK